MCAYFWWTDFFNSDGTFIFFASIDQQKVISMIKLFDDLQFIFKNKTSLNVIIFTTILDVYL
jgi:hypothetical protein